jgi:hypothetical protein
MRKGWDSNPRTAFDGHTLSRRANSTALAPFRYRFNISEIR